jgi:peptidoglycan/LPS O-acetylase OafA/YrhL
MESTLTAPAELATFRTPRRLSDTASAHLNLARGLAAAAVAFQHLRSVLLLDWPQTSVHSPLAAGVYFLAKFAHPAVIVFFVLSGFLVGSSGVRAVESRTWSLPRYMLHRVLRLEIVLLPALLLGLLWDNIGIRVLHASALYNGGWHLLVRQGPIDLSWRALLGNAAFVQDILVPTYGTNGALWSLSYEFWYYVLFGLLVTACLRTTRLWLRLMLTALILVVAWFTGFAIIFLAPLWFLGLGVYWLPRLTLSRSGRRILVGASTLLFLAFLGVIFGRRAPVEVLTRPLMIDLVTGVLFSVVLYAVLHANSARSGYRQIAHHIAAPTYSLYANHLPAMIVLLAAIGVRKAPTPLHCLELAGWFIVFWLYGYGLYLLFEARTQTIRSWIEPRLFPTCR